MYIRSISTIACVSGKADHVTRVMEGAAPVITMIMTHYCHTDIGLCKQCRKQLYMQEKTKSSMIWSFKTLCYCFKHVGSTYKLTVFLSLGTHCIIVSSPTEALRVLLLIPSAIFTRVSLNTHTEKLWAPYTHFYMQTKPSLTYLPRYVEEGNSRDRAVLCSELTGSIHKPA